ncbi:glycerophosphodiester phosphodiesterase family protein [Anaerocolumna xylanovorans]|uniref:Glycerophosphoryl diester phosphodiesterase n=1 Tax=Anaerocolumna xylanovorans DSM 12503 TaxID=1121345 RepID=A0A1M7YJZ8_9FIRM|nr:glycerophosphodiester phosphodiesterase family protein [Anaerocolumna xylanovorans]SHO52927.1 glycerophosphoryl diester phosphodiesterase [Anaerocolumna xylanovorans DSM 12503]
MDKIEHKKILHIYAQTIKIIARNILYLVIGQGILMAAAYFLLFPLVNEIVDITLKLTGYSYITVGNIDSFLLRPVTILMLLILFIIIGIFLTLDILFLITFFALTERGQKIKISILVKLTVYRLFYCLKKGRAAALITSWILAILSGIPFIFFSIWRFRILHYYMEAAPDGYLALAAILFIAGLLLFLYYVGPYYYHSLLTEKSGILAVSKKDILPHERRNLLISISGWNILLAGVLFLIYVFTMSMTALLVSGFTDRIQATATFIEVYDSMSVYLALIIFVFGITANMALISYTFHRYRKLKINGHEEAEGFFKPAYPYKKIIYFLIIALFSINFYYFYQVVRNGSALEYMNMEDIQVTSHRGYSHSVPENTLAAVSKAIAEKADYVEVDVRVTKDGEMVLLHDTSLKRTTGFNKYIWDVPYEQVSELDAGSWFGSEFTGTKIPTLRELFDLCKGQIKINMDLKYRNDSEELAQKVVALIGEYDMQKQCVITSTSIRCLKEVKEANPEIRTGYITYGIYTSLFGNDAIDFFSMKSNLVTKNIVNEVHRNGKKVLAWTVNTRSEVERLKRLGIDNIITDNPAYIREILQRDDSDKFLTTLLKVIKE